MKPPQIDVTREIQPVLDILNQVFEIEKKVMKLSEENTIARNIRRLRSQFEDGDWQSRSAGTSLSLTYHDPAGEAYDETRADCEASIAGPSADNLRIVETIKPIIRLKQGDSLNIIVQRAVVVVAAAPES